MVFGLPAPTLRSMMIDWRSEANEVRKLYAAEAVARTLERCATAIESALAAQAEELVTLERAAEISGYHPDSLRRMEHEGTLKAERRGRRLYFRAGDLPLKPSDPSSEVDGLQLVSYDPRADARMVARERQRGG
jgi:hypothetical protein